MFLIKSFPFSLPKMNMADIMKSASSSGAIDLSEVQDFSMSSKKLSLSSPSSTMSNTSSIQAALSSAFPSMASKGGKLDDTLNKLMKKNNCVSFWNNNIKNFYTN